MKRFLLIFSLIFTGINIDAQTVENIQVEQNGDLLNIHYRIGNSTSDQLFEVKLSCTIDNGPVFEPKTIRGDVGDNIRGGKSNNTIIWDVFKDVEEVGSIEFFVKINMTKDESESEIIDIPDREEQVYVAKEEVHNQEDPVFNHNKMWYDKNLGTTRHIFVGYDGCITHPLGVRAGFLGNWGGNLAFRYGGYDTVWYGYRMTITGGVTKRILNFERMGLHGYFNVGLGGLLDYTEVGLGFICIINNKLNVNLGLVGNAFYDYVSTGSLGIGYVF